MTELRKARKGQGLRLADVAEAANVSITTLSQIEVGKRLVDIAIAKKLAAAVGRSESRLFKPQTFVARPVSQQ